MHRTREFSNKHRAPVHLAQQNGRAVHAQSPGAWQGCTWQGWQGCTCTVTWQGCTCCLPGRAVHAVHLAGLYMLFIWQGCTCCSSGRAVHLKILYCIYSTGYTNGYTNDRRQGVKGLPDHNYSHIECLVYIGSNFSELASGAKTTPTSLTHKTNCNIWPHLFKHQIWLCIVHPAYYVFPVHQQ
jgi:hypothetical protein